MLKKDNMWLGIALGTVLPVVLYLIILLIMKLVGTTPAGDYVLKQSSMVLLALFSNMITFRYYMINLKYDKTGRGILLVTFVCAAIYFYMFM
jgi:hypothetical protein